MAINIADNFQYQGKKPLDSRTSYATLALMKVVTDSNINEGCLAYCEETQKHYEFKSTNTVDETTGKWREYSSGGGGGASSLNDLSDVEVEEPSNGQVLKYNSETEKFENANESGGGGASELNDLDDVAVSSPSSGDILKYNSSTQKFENAASGGEDVVRGYAYAVPVTSMEDFIARVNNRSGYNDITYTNGIFNDKSVKAACLFQTSVSFYLLFSAYEFDISAMQVKQDGAYKCSISRKLLEGTSHIGYDSQNSLTNGITSLVQETLTNDWVFDTTVTDADKTGYFFVTGNVGFDERYGSYNDNTIIVDGLDFYSDSAHTQKITPVAGKEYYDIPTGKTYRWDGKEYQLSSTTDYSEMTNKPKVNGVELSGNKSLNDLGIKTYTGGSGINVSQSGEITTDNMKAGDIDDVVTPLPSGGRQIVAGFTPVGTVISVMGNSAPTHYLACNGQVVNIADYPELAEYFEAQFGQVNKFGGDGTTTFGIPDLRGEFLRGTGTNSHTNQGSGANVGVHQDATTTSKYSTATAGTQHAIIYNSGNRLYPTNFDSEFLSADGTLGLVTLTGTSSSTGNTKDLITSRPTNTSVLYCIATKDIYLDPRNMYSTSERVVGEWIDGKPLYQKTIQLNTLELESSRYHSITLPGVTNLDKIIDYKCIGFASNGSEITAPFRSVNVSGELDNNFLGLSFANGYFDLRSQTDRTAMTFYCTFQYTKTTS